MWHSNPGSKHPYTGTTFRVISHTEVSLRNFCFEWLSLSSEAYQSFSFLLGNQPPTGCPIPRLGGGFQSSDKKLRLGPESDSFPFCLYWKFHVRITWGNSVKILTFRVLPFRAYEHVTEKARIAHSVSSHNSSLP